MDDSLLQRLTRHVATHPPRVEDDPDLIQAAVALVFAPDPDALLLIRRAERREDPWSGQMGLPGGRRDPGDAALLATAIRETREEVGLDLLEHELVGPLDDVAPRTPVLPPIMVRPFVFRLPVRRLLRPNQEIAHAAWVPLESLTRPGVFGEYPVEARGITMTRAGYRLGEGVVWGMTERILSGLLERLRV